MHQQVVPRTACCRRLVLFGRWLHCQWRVPDTWLPFFVLQRWLVPAMEKYFVVSKIIHIYICVQQLIRTTRRRPDQSSGTTRWLPDLKSVVQEWCQSRTLTCESIYCKVYLLLEHCDNCLSVPAYRRWSCCYFGFHPEICAIDGMHFTFTRYSPPVAIIIPICLFAIV